MDKMFALVIPTLMCMQNIVTSSTHHPLLIKVTSSIPRADRDHNIFFLFLFFYQGFLHRHWRFTAQQRKEGDHLLFLSTTSTRSRTLRHLFATLQDLCIIWYTVLKNKMLVLLACWKMKYSRLQFSLPKKSFYFSL